MSLLFFCSICFLMPIHADAAKKAVKARRAYAQMLAAPTLDWGDREYPTDSMKFFCGDMNGDKVPELVVQYDSAYGYEGIQRVYTYYIGKVVRVFMTGNCQAITRYYPKKKVFVESGGRMGWSLTRYCKLKGKRVTVVAQIQEPDSYMALSYGTVYRIKNKKVTKAVFKKKVRSLTGKGKGKKVKLRLNTVENRRKWI